MAELMTPKELAAATNAAEHRVLYVLLARAIQPVRRAGRVRLYDAAILVRLRDELAKTDRYSSRRRAVRA